MILTIKQYWEYIFRFQKKKFSSSDAARIFFSGFLRCKRCNLHSWRKQEKNILPTPLFFSFILKSVNSNSFFVFSSVIFLSSQFYFVTRTINKKIVKLMATRTGRNYCVTCGGCFQKFCFCHSADHRYVCSSPKRHRNLQRVSTSFRRC